MRLRRARTLVLTFVDATPILRNFMTRHAMPVNGFALDLVSRADRWQTPEDFRVVYAGVPPALIETYLRGLTEQGFLVVEGTPAAAIDAEYETFWQWDTAAMYHFGVKDPPWLNAQQSAEWMHHVSATKPAVPLCTTNDGLENVVAMEPPDLEHGLLSIMNRRRSVRSYVSEPVSRRALGDCLFAGLGITGLLNTRLPGEDPRVLLKMTPSGGARNPYEGFVYARRVADLDFGLYHYSAIDHTLGLLTKTPVVTTSQLFAGQHWTEGAAFAILLVANFGRTMWKYPHPNAYRVVLMEAGHIGQNVALAAAEHGLSATPTAAINDTAAQALLGLDWVRQSLVYAILVGKPQPDAFELENFTPREQSRTPSPSSFTPS